MKKQMKIILVVVILVLVGGYYIYQKNNVYNKPKPNQISKSTTKENLKKNAIDEVTKAESSKSEKDSNAAKQAVEKLPEGPDKKSLVNRLNSIVPTTPSIKVEHKTKVKPSLDVGKKTMIIVQMTNTADDGKYYIFYNNQKLSKLDTGLYSIDVVEDTNETQANSKVIFKAIQK